MLVGLALAIGASWALADTQQDCMQHNDPDLQVRACSSIIDGNGGASWPYYSRGVAYGIKGDYERAIADFTRAIEIGRDPYAYNDRGLAYELKGDYERAIADYDMAIEIFPRYGTAYNHRGFVYARKGDHCFLNESLDGFLSVMK